MDDQRTEKNVFLIGDKVRYSTDVDCGYGMFLMDELSGRAYVYSPPADCESVQHTLRHLNDWVMKSYVECDEVDVVYWNNGLWDVERMYDGEPITQLDVYVRQLVRVYWSIRRQFPNAKVIFAATTPVIEQEPEEACAYRNSDIEQYNRAAREALEPLGAAYDDLYAVAKRFSVDCYRTCAYFSQKGALRFFCENRLRRACFARRAITGRPAHAPNRQTTSSFLCAPAFYRGGAADKGERTEWG